MAALPEQRSARRAATGKTADRTLDVFELFASEQRPLNLSEIAELLRIPLSSAHALIKRLQARGYLYDAGRRQGYFPTTRMQDVVHAISRGAPMLAALRPVLTALRDETGETVVLARRQGDTVVYVEVFESPHTVRFSSVAGEMKPLHSTSSGKAILSSLSSEDLDKLLPRLAFERRTEATLTSARALRAAIEQGRERGYCQSVGENAPDLMAVSAPIRVGSETYAVTLGGPTTRFKPETEKHAAALLRACRRMEGRPERHRTPRAATAAAARGGR